jgi:predicted acyl esterase
VNDGVLSLALPASDGGKDEYVVDYTTSSGKAARWVNAYSGPFGYLDMVANDEKGLTYTTAPLHSDMEVTGHPVVQQTRKKPHCQSSSASRWLSPSQRRLL